MEVSTLLKIAIWGAIILLLILGAKRIGRGLVGVGVLVASLFLAIFLLDTFTMFDTRRYIPIAFYDKTIEDPQGTVQGLKEGAGTTGQSWKDRINLVGEKADEKYGTGRGDKDGVVDEKKTEKGTGKEKEPKKEVENQKEKTNTDIKKDKDFKNTMYVTYKEAKGRLDKELPGMNERDKTLALSLVPMLPMRYVGTEYEMWNEKGEDGFYIKKKVQ